MSETITPKETINGKEVIDVRPEQVQPDKNEAPKEIAMFFTVSLVTKTRPIHILVKADSAVEALRFAQEVEKAPAVGVHVTEYSKYYDATCVDDVDVVEEEKNVKSVETESVIVS